MIQAIESRAGLSTETPAALKAPPRSRQFSTVLENTKQDPPNAVPPRSRPAATQDLQSRAVSRRPNRDATAEGGPASAPTPTDASAEHQPVRASKPEADGTERPKEEEDGHKPNTTLVDGTAVRMPAQPQPLTAQQLAGAAPREGAALATPPADPTLAQGYAPSGQVGSTLQAQLGRAAYNLNPHGVGEPAQVTYTAPAGAAAALQAADPGQQGLPAEPHVVTVQEIVQLSNAAHAAMIASQDSGAKPKADPAEANRDVGRADPNSAQSRNQVLAQIGGAAGAAPIQAPAANPGASQGNTGSPGGQSQGSAHLKAGKPAAAEAPAPADATAAGFATGAASVAAAHPSRDSQAVADSRPQLDPALMNKIVQESRWLIRGGHAEVTLKLQPESLGEMKLKVVHKDGDLTVQMTVDSAAAKHLLDANLKQLREQLQSENLAQGNLLLNVDVRQGGDSGGFAGLATPAARQERTPAAGTAPAEEAPRASRAQPAAWGHSNISIYA